LVSMKSKHGAGLLFDSLFIFLFWWFFL
jgi:hypothetical protein